MMMSSQNLSVERRMRTELIIEICSRQVDIALFRMWPTGALSGGNLYEAKNHTDRIHSDGKRV